MKQTLLTFVAIALLAVPVLRADDTPRGEFLEVHSCQVYIGGCIASAEATQDGRYMLRVWNFTDGALAGLQVALLQVGDENLADKDTLAKNSLAYLPESATAAQTAALVDWLKQNNPGLARLQTRKVALRLTRQRNSISFTAGNSVHIQTQPFAACGLASCGEALWYTPRTTAASYTVNVTRESTVREPLLALTWIDHGKNNAFEGRFDESQTTGTFNPPTMACVSADHHAHE